MRQWKRHGDRMIVDERGVYVAQFGDMESRDHVLNMLEVRDLDEELERDMRDDRLVALAAGALMGLCKRPELFGSKPERYIGQMAAGIAQATLDSLRRNNP